jgi:serine/threonine protein phosphatase PrpC
MFSTSTSDETVGGNEAACFSRRGRRNDVNQDRAIVVSPYQLPGVPAGDNFLIAVFDGHGEGGELMSEFASQNLPTMLASALEQQLLPLDASKVTDALTAAFRRLHDECPPLESAGTTVSAALRLGDMLYLANAGDSITFVAGYSEERGIIYWKTKLHKPDEPDERARIEKCGGVVTEAKPGPRQSARLSLGEGKGTIAFSRSIGDRDATPVGLIPDPTVQVLNLTKLVSSEWFSNMYVVSVTDGISDVFSLYDISDDIGQQLFGEAKYSSRLSLQTRCERLVDSANNEWIKLYPYNLDGDDMSIAVHKLF